MKIVLYAAMTAGEFEKCPPTSLPVAWMACHFSSYTTGLSNLPGHLPEGSLLILNDRTPICGHDPVCISRQLAETVDRLNCSGILLDLQRPGAEDVAAAVAALPCPVAATPDYARTLDCGVFLPPPPLTVPLAQYLSPWKGRELWLEAALEQCTVRVTRDGAHEVEYDPKFFCPHVDEALHCRYGIDPGAAQVDFHLCRDWEQLAALMEEGAKMGIGRYVGLYQQLAPFSQPEAQATARFQL